MSKIGKYWIEICKFVVGLHSTVTLTHSLTKKDSMVAYAQEAVSYINGNISSINGK